MSVPFRSARVAAQIAAIRINELSNQTSDSTNTTNNIIRAREKGYDNAVYVINYLLDECNNADFEDERTEIAMKMFQYINANPTILSYEPVLCKAVMKKITGLIEHINQKTEMYKKAEYNKAIQMMKLSMRLNVRNSKMRDNIYKHLDDISSILADYSHWSKRSQLKTEMNKVARIIHTIPSNTCDMN
jgi:hypothetical protein